MTGRLARLALALLALLLAVASALAVAPTDPIATVAGTGEPGHSGDGGLATEARLLSPVGASVGPDGSLYIAEFNGRVVRRVGPDGGISTFAGLPGQAGADGDGGPATQARLQRPYAVLAAPDGAVYVADREGHRVRRVGPDGIITTVAGTGSRGSSGDGGPATQARLDLPAGLARDAAGALYVSELGGARVRRIGPDGIITTYAGTGSAGFAGDGGPAVAARLNNPVGLALDDLGNLLIADLDNNRVRNVAPDGTITTLAGTGAAGSTGDGGPAAAAALNRPVGVVVGAGRGVYVSEFAGGRVRRVGPEGLIVTVAGTGAAAGSTGDGGPAAEAALRSPLGLAINRRDDLYIAESDGHRVRRVRNTLPAVGAAGVRCAPVPPRPAAGDGQARLTLSTRQLLINQRISQAAVRRLNAVRDWLDAGIAAGDLCGGSIGPEKLGAGIVTEQVAQRVDIPVAAPRPVPVAAARGSAGPRVTLSARQLLINQRVSQAAVRRANALEARLRGGLTGGDLLPGQITAGQLASHLGVVSVAPAPTPAPSVTRVAPAGRGRAGEVRLTVRQLRINQRISQAAVRRANALIDRLRAGLTGAQFQDGTVTSGSLAPELRGF